MTAYNPTYITSMYTRPPNPPRVLLMSELEVRFCLYLTHAGHSKYYMGVLFRWDVNYSQPVSPRFHLSGVYHLDDLPCFSPSSRWVFAISSPRCRDFYWLTWSLQARGPAYTDMWHPAMQGPWYLVENATIQGYMKAESIPGFRQPMFFMLRASEYCSTEDNHKGERHWRITLLMWAWEEREPLSYRNAVEGTFGFVKLWKMDPKYR